MSEITVTVVGSTAPSALVTGSSTVNVTFADQASGVGNPAAATIQVGNVTTVAATESASVVNVGTAYAAKLDFAIPRGAMTGLKIGTVTSGTAAAASITGTAPSLSLNLTLPVGATGATGPANSLAIGTVASGTAAAASITGSAPSQVLSLTLPKGDTGATGPAAALAIGTVTVGTAAAASITGVAPSQVLSLTLPPAPPNVLSIGTVTTTAGTAASATISGTSPSQVLSLVLPQGPTGNTGPAGPPNSLSIGVVASGSSPAATLSGTAPNQVLNLVLPAGPQGATGATGAAGPANSLVIGSVVEGAAAGASITGAAPSQVLNLVMPVNSLSIGTVSSGTAAAAQITGNAPSQVLSLTLPQGAVGQTGPANSLSIGAVSSGTAASATITGSAPSQTLSLVLPKGDTGAAGGVTKLNGLTGTVSILAGQNVTVTTASSSITIASGGGEGVWVSPPLNPSSAGTLRSLAQDDDYLYVRGPSRWKRFLRAQWEEVPSAPLAAGYTLTNTTPIYDALFAGDTAGGSLQQVNGVSNVVLSWQAPQWDGDSPITGYKIAYAHTNSGVWLYRNVNASTFTTTFSGNEKIAWSARGCGNISFVVYAVNAVGDSIGSLVNVRLPPTTPNSPPVLRAWRIAGYGSSTPTYRLAWSSICWNLGGGNGQLRKVGNGGGAFSEPTGDVVDLPPTHFQLSSQQTFYNNWGPVYAPGAGADGWSPFWTCPINQTYWDSIDYDVHQRKWRVRTVRLDADGLYYGDWSNVETTEP